MPKKPTLARLSEIVQSGSIAGLAAIPVISDLYQFRATPRLLIAASVLAPVAVVSSLWIGRSGAKERGVWGIILTVAFYLWAWATPVAM